MAAHRCLSDRPSHFCREAGSRESIALGNPYAIPLTSRSIPKRFIIEINGRLIARQGRRLRGATARPMEAVDIFQQIFHGQVSQDIQGILPTPLVSESTDFGLLVSALQVFQAGLADRLGELKLFRNGGHICSCNSLSVNGIWSRKRHLRVGGRIS